VVLRDGLAAARARGPHRLTCGACAERNRFGRVGRIPTPMRFGCAARGRARPPARLRARGVPPLGRTGRHARARGCGPPEGESRSDDAAPRDRHRGRSPCVPRDPRREQAVPGARRPRARGARGGGAAARSGGLGRLAGGGRAAPRAAVRGARAPHRIAQAPRDRPAVPQPLRERLGDLPAPASGGGTQGPRPDAGGCGPRRALPVGGPALRDARGDLRVRAPRAGLRMRLRAWALHRGVDAGLLSRRPRRAGDPHGVFQPARGALPAEQPAPDQARADRQPPLRRGDVRTPPPEAGRPDDRARLAPAAPPRGRPGRALLLRAHASRRSRGPLGHGVDRRPDPGAHSDGADRGRCAVDIDNDHDYEAARARFEVWRERQRLRAERAAREIA